MNLYLESLTFAATVTLPIFFLVLLGWLFRRTGLINENFIETGSKLVFTAALPALIFINIVQLDIGEVLHTGQIGYALVSTLLVFLALWWGGSRWIANGADRGVFIQGAFRANLGIIGLALCANLYGKEGLAIGSILLASVTLLYNVLSVFILTVSVQQSPRIDWRKLFVDLLRNPLIIAILSALPLAWLDLRLPAMLLQTGQYFADLTLPLALLCVGASIDLRALHNTSGLSSKATLLRLVLIPAVQTFGAWMLGLPGIMLGTLFLMLASPTATVSFIMAKALGGNAPLAANIVAQSTLLSVLTISGGLFLLRLFQLI